MSFKLTDEDIKYLQDQQAYAQYSNQGKLNSQQKDWQKKIVDTPAELVNLNQAMQGITTKNFAFTPEILGKTPPKVELTPEEVDRLAPEGSYERFKYYNALNKAGLAKIETDEHTPTLIQYRPHKQSFVQDALGSFYNTVCVDNWSGYAQLFGNLGLGIAKGVMPESIDKHLEQYDKDMNDWILSYREFNRIPESDKALGIDPDSWKWNANRAASGLGGFFGFMTALAVDIAITEFTFGGSAVGIASKTKGLFKYLGKTVDKTKGIITKTKDTVVKEGIFGAAKKAGIKTGETLAEVTSKEGIKKGVSSAKQLIDKLKNVTDDAIRTKEARKGISGFIRNQTPGMVAASALIYGGVYEAAVAAGMPKEHINSYTMATSVPLALAMYIPFGSAFKGMFGNSYLSQMKNTIKGRLTPEIAKILAKRGTAKGDEIKAMVELFNTNPKRIKGIINLMMGPKREAVKAMLTSMPKHALTTSVAMGSFVYMDAFAQQLYDSYFAKPDTIIGEGKFGTTISDTETHKAAFRSALLGAFGGAILGAMGGLGRYSKDLNATYGRLAIDAANEIVNSGGKKQVIYNKMQERIKQLVDYKIITEQEGLWAAERQKDMVTTLTNNPIIAKNKNLSVKYQYLELDYAERQLRNYYDTLKELYNNPNLSKDEQFDLAQQMYKIIDLLGGSERVSDGLLTLMKAELNTSEESPPLAIQDNRWEQLTDNFTFLREHSQKVIEKAINSINEKIIEKNKTLNPEEQIPLLSREKADININETGLINAKEAGYESYETPGIFSSDNQVEIDNIKEEVENTKQRIVKEHEKILDETKEEDFEKVKGEQQEELYLFDNAARQINITTKENKQKEGYAEKIKKIDIQIQEEVSNLQAAKENKEEKTIKETLNRIKELRSKKEKINTELLQPLARKIAKDSQAIEDILVKISEKYPEPKQDVKQKTGKSPKSPNKKEPEPELEATTKAKKTEPEPEPESETIITPKDETNAIESIAEEMGTSAAKINEFFKSGSKILNASMKKLKFEARNFRSAFRDAYMKELEAKGEKANIGDLGKDEIKSALATAFAELKNASDISNKKLHIISRKPGENLEIIEPAKKEKETEPTFIESLSKPKFSLIEQIRTIKETAQKESSDNLLTVREKIMAELPKEEREKASDKSFPIPTRFVTKLKEAGLKPPKDTNPINYLLFLFKSFGSEINLKNNFLPKLIEEFETARRKVNKEGKSASELTDPLLKKIFQNITLNDIKTVQDRYDKFTVDVKKESDILFENIKGIRKTSEQLQSEIDKAKKEGNTDEALKLLRTLNEGADNVKYEDLTKEQQLKIIQIFDLLLSANEPIGKISKFYTPPEAKSINDYTLTDIAKSKLIAEYQIKTLLEMAKNNPKQFGNLRILSDIDTFNNSQIGKKILQALGFNPIGNTNPFTYAAQRVINVNPELAKQGWNNITIEHLEAAGGEYVDNKAELINSAYRIYKQITIENDNPDSIEVLFKNASKDEELINLGLIDRTGLPLTDTQIIELARELVVDTPLSIRYNAKLEMQRLYVNKLLREIFNQYGTIEAAIGKTINIRDGVEWSTEYILKLASDFHIDFSEAKLEANKGIEGLKYDTILNPDEYSTNTEEPIIRNLYDLPYNAGKIKTLADVSVHMAKVISAKLNNPKAEEIFKTKNQIKVTAENYFRILKEIKGGDKKVTLTKEEKSLLKEYKDQLITLEKQLDIPLDLIFDSLGDNINDYLPDALNFLNNKQHAKNYISKILLDKNIVFTHDVTLKDIIKAHDIGKIKLLNKKSLTNTSSIKLSDLSETQYTNYGGARSLLKSETGQAKYPSEIEEIIGEEGYDKITILKSLHNNTDAKLQSEIDRIIVKFITENPEFIKYLNSEAQRIAKKAISDNKEFSFLKGTISSFLNSNVKRESILTATDYYNLVNKSITKVSKTERVKEIRQYNITNEITYAHLKELAGQLSKEKKLAFEEINKQKQKKYKNVTFTAKPYAKAYIDNPSLFMQDFGANKFKKKDEQKQKWIKTHQKDVDEL